MRLSIASLGKFYIILYSQIVLRALESVAIKSETAVFPESIMFTQPRVTPVDKSESAQAFNTMQLYVEQRGGEWSKRKCVAK